MRIVTFAVFASLALCADLPRGFERIFNGKDLTGWHISAVNHHGNTQGWTVKDGVLLGTQDQPGNGGILLTDKKYKNFEVSLEVNPDFGCDGGLFLRSSEKGEAYQVMLDYLEGGTVGGIYGERLKGLDRETGKGDKSAKDWQQHWKKGEWNHIRARIEGDVPHIQVWMNGKQIVDWTDSGNRLPAGATDGMIAVQVHRNDPKAKNQRWIPNGYHRFRNIAVREIR
ncbi:MAG TPA: DUF1080 domain-containing protein [Bryobacteraceae bacterium]|nr:DUF1080 domain-containing protein [Bryobacteraceae bacterium]